MPDFDRNRNRCAVLSCLVLHHIAVISGTAVIRVLEEGHVGQPVQIPDAHDSRAVGASLVRQKQRFGHTQVPRVENCPSGELCYVVRGSHYLREGRMR